jgi:hypothetical protein
MVISAKSTHETCSVLAHSEGNIKTSFLLKRTQVKKLRYISVVDEITQTEIIDQLLSKYISDWENNNGKIPVKQ